MTNLKFTHMLTPINSYTFSNKKIKAWVEKNSIGKVLNLFAGKVRLNLDETRVDLRKDMFPDYCMDALQFVKYWDRHGEYLFDTVILDPPYAYRKSMEFYEGAVSSPFNQIKKYLPDIMSSNSRVITFGYHSVSMGSKRGFTLVEILIMSHGGSCHDTIACIEQMNGKQIKLGKDPYDKLVIRRRKNV